MKIPLSIALPTVNEDERLAWYRKHRTLLAFIQWIPYLLVIPLALAVLNTNPSEAWLLLALGAFLASGAAVYYLAMVWARCLACGQPFSLMIWSRVATMSMFPEYCSKCHAPVMALPPTQTTTKTRSEWSTALIKRYSDMARRCERLQSTILWASIALALLTVGKFAAMPFLRSRGVDVFYVFRLYTALYLSGLAFILILYSLVRISMQTLNRCPECKRRLSDRLFYRRESTDYKKCRTCQCNLAPLFQA